jgi:hypothetical protein
MTATKMTGPRWQPTPPVHWQHPARPDGTAVCHGRQTTAPVTTDRARVTCGTCREARAWRAAA